VQLDGRTKQVDFYRRGFNGMEKDDELKGGGNSYDFGARMYDSRVGRWWNRDALENKYPHLSPYVFVGNSPLIMNDPNGESGEVTIDKNSRTVTVESHIVLYGSKASDIVALSTAKDIQDTWNDANGKVMIGGIEYKVKFKITGEYKPSLTPAEIAKNTDIKNNYVRVEDENIAGVSNYNGNSGYFLTRNIAAKGSTTEAHEMGHGWGIDFGTADGHPVNTDLRGKGQPGIMHARGTIVDPQYQYDPNASPGAKGGTLNPEKRKVTQENINELNLDKLIFDSNGKAELGTISNIIDMMKLLQNLKLYLIILFLSSCSLSKYKSLKNSIWIQSDKEKINYVELRFDKKNLIATSLGDTIFRFKCKFKKNNLYLTDINRKVTKIKIINYHSDILIFESFMEHKTIQTYLRK